jgi:hypothetical protein
LLQLIAMTTMLIDHIGFIFFPNTEFLRVIGRIAFPLYSWFLVQGYRHTKDVKKYMWRLFWLACLSQIPFTLALQVWELNVIFTLLLALFALYTIDHVADASTKFPLILLIIFASFVIPMDYGLYGVLLILLLRYFSNWNLIFYHMLLNLVFLYFYGSGYMIQFFSIAGTVLIFYLSDYKPYISVIRGRWLYRSFYPAHLLLLFIIHTTVQYIK